ncbi:MAG: hypothetical protein R6U88_03425 [Candidatus Bipolaricaulota bacterium]
MGNNYLANPEGRWFVARMGLWEWLETLLKLAAVGAAMWGLSLAITQGWGLGMHGRTAQVAILGAASLGILAAVADRLATREVVSTAFVVINNFGHWGITAALVGGLGGGAPLVLFCSVMLAGDLAKLVFFARSGLTVRDAPRAAVLGGTGLFALCYLGVLLLEVL